MSLMYGKYIEQCLYQCSSDFGVRIVLFILIMIFYSKVSYAQSKDSCNYELNGTVLDEDTKGPLAFVLIKIKDTDQSTITGFDGRFQFYQLCEPNNTLILSCYGYCDTACEQHHKHGKTPHIYLKKQVNVLDEVTIEVEKPEDLGTGSIAKEEITKEELNENPFQTLASAIADVNGVTFTSNGGNVQLPVIHGLYGNRVLILNNGLKHGFQNWGTDHAPEIDVMSADRITIVKGAAGVRYGPDALAGAIIVEGDPLHLNEPFKASVGTGYQTNGRGYFGNGEFGEGFKNWSYHVGGSYNRVGDLNTPDYSLTNSGKIEYGANAGLRYKIENLDVNVYYSYVSQNLGIYRTALVSTGESLSNAINAEKPIFIEPFSYDISEPNQVIDHHLGRVEADWWYSDHSKLTFRYGRQLNRRDEFDVRRNEEKPIINLDLITNDYQLEWKHPDWKKLDGVIGVQAFTQNSDNNPGTGTTPFIPNYNILRYSTYIIETLEKNQNTYELGLRYDYENSNVRGRETNQDIFRDQYEFSSFTASAGLTKRYSDHTTFRSNLGMGWRPPNMAELYSFGQHGFKIQYGLLRYYYDDEGAVRTNRVTQLANANIGAERGYKWINEWESDRKTGTYTVTAYAHYIENFIYDRPFALRGTIRGPMPLFIFEQSDATFLGTDITWQRSLNETLQGTLSVNYLWSRNVERAEPLINQPPVTMAYELKWNEANLSIFKESVFKIRPSYTFQQFQAPRTVTPLELIEGSVEIKNDSEIFDFQDAPNGYFLIELGWHFKIGAFETGISIQNLLNSRYRNYLNEMRYFVDEPGINVLFTTKYMFNSKPNTR